MAPLLLTLLAIDRAMAGDLPVTAVTGGIQDEDLGRYQWETQVSRFFRYPRVSHIPSTRKLKPRFASRSGCYVNDGIWISSSSAALLHLLTNPPAILSVSFQGAIHEEHFVSDLHFSWPQISCGAECPLRGSRVVFVSYRDSANQIQKFALRFFSFQDAQTFLDVVEEILNSSLNMEYPRESDGCDKSSHLEDTASNEILHYRAEGMGFTDMTIGYQPEMPTSSFEGEQHVHLQSLLPAYNVDSVVSSLIPIFASLTRSCSAENFKEALKMPMDADFLSRMMRYLSDSSFLDMLDKVEKIIDDMGVNLLHYSHPACF